MFEERVALLEVLFVFFLSFFFSFSPLRMTAASHCVRDVNCCLFIRSYYFIKQTRTRDSHLSFRLCEDQTIGIARNGGV